MPAIPPPRVLEERGRQPRDDAEWHDWEHERLEHVGPGREEERGIGYNLSQAVVWLGLFALIAFALWLRHGS